MKQIQKHETFDKRSGLLCMQELFFNMFGKWETFGDLRVPTLYNIIIRDLNNIGKC